MADKVLLIIAFLMIIFWSIGFFIYAIGAIIHLLLVVTVIAVILLFLRWKRRH